MEAIVFSTVEEAVEALLLTLKDRGIGEWTLEELSKLPIPEQLRVMADKLEVEVEIED